MILLFLACAASPDRGALDPSGGVETAGGLYRLVLSPDPDPPTAGETALLLDITDADGGKPAIGAAVTVEPWMPDHGHGVSEEPTVEEQGGGSYLAEWSYPMPGSWELTLSVDGEAGADEVVVAYEVQ